MLQHVSGNRQGNRGNFVIFLKGIVVKDAGFSFGALLMLFSKYPNVEFRRVEVFVTEQIFGIVDAFHEFI